MLQNLRAGLLSARRKTNSFCECTSTELNEKLNRGVLCCEVPVYIRRAVSISSRF
jgi:hypothetical protein